MKKTTYIMLGAMVAGMVGVAVSTVGVIRENMSYVSKYTLGGDNMVIPVDPVTKVVYDDSGIESDKLKIENVKGITVLESDTARMTTIHFRSDWKPYLDCRSDSGTLTVSVDYKAMLKEYFSNSDWRYRVYLTSENINIATVVMPRGTLREVEAKDKTIYLDSVRATEIISRVEDRLVINNSDIRLLNSPAGRLSELKLDNSIVGDVNLSGVDKNFKVTCTSDSSVIDNIYIDRVYEDAKNAYFRLDKANIKNFKFNPENDNVLLNVKMKGNMNGFLKK